MRIGPSVVRAEPANDDLIAPWGWIGALCSRYPARLKGRPTRSGAVGHRVRIAKGIPAVPLPAASASLGADGRLRPSDALERTCFSPPLEPMCPLIGVYECPPGCVYQSMRHTFWLLILLAGPGGAQWRHFGEGQPAIEPYSLARDMLAVHNAVRARVGTAPLAWSHPLAARSQDWADTLLARGQFAHRPNSPYGENLFEIEGAAASPAEVVEAWAGESRNYDYSSNRCRGVCGHYTQIVWRDTKEMGCAVARGRGREVWVCDYDPPGNWRPY